MATPAPSDVPGGEGSSPAARPAGRPPARRATSASRPTPSMSASPCPAARRGPWSSGTLTIVASDVARIFLQNSINLGVNVITAPGGEASIGDEVVVEGTKVHNRTTWKSWDVVPLPPARQAIIDAGGLIACTRKKMLEARAKG